MEVTALHRNEKDTTYKLSVGNQILETTDNHQFWVDGKGWVLAVDLKVGDEIVQSNGNHLKIDNIEIVHHDAKVKVYNFTVADFHTYFVSSLGIWVHNIKCTVNPGDLTPRGRTLSGHAAERVNQRGFTPEIIDNIIKNNKKNSVSKLMEKVEKLEGILILGEIQL